MSASSTMTGTVVRTAAVTIELLAIPAGLRLRGHGHDRTHLCFLAGGAFEERDARRSRAVSAGTLRRSPAGDEHDIHFRAPSRCLLVLVHGNPGGVPFRLPADRAFLATARIGALAKELTGCLDAPHDASALHLEVLAIELLAASMPPSGRRASVPPDWLQRIRDRIRDEPASPPPTSDLAGDAGYHPVYVARAFREYFGMGVGAYARLMQAEHARDLLARSGESLAQIAAAAGYADQSHLSRAMRRMLGSTPGNVRDRRGRVIHVASVQDSARETA